MNQYKTLFEQQSYQDALDYYQATLAHFDLPVWDYVILTASNEAQAEGYEAQISYRQQKGQLPSATHLAVIPDLNGQRIGSGGATLSAIRYVHQHAGTFASKRILCIHSGGTASACLSIRLAVSCSARCRVNSRMAAAPHCSMSS